MKLHRRAASTGSRRIGAVAGLFALGLLVVLNSRSLPAQTGTIDYTVNRQQVEGFGFAEPFGAAQSVAYLSQDMQNQVWDLMFNPTTGAGLNALRLGINTDSRIEPNDPGSPGATPAYVFDGSDGKQVQAARIAQHYGVSNFFATSWTAPAFMKTNNSEDNGGALCGTVGATCASGDWRQAYANFLVQYVNDYKSVGVPISALSFQNEPDYAPGYQSMTMTNNQVIDFVQNAFGPTMRARLPQVRTMCCDGFNWASQTVYTGALPYYPLANSYIDIVTAHEYGVAASFPQSTTKPVWMTEWATLNTTDELRWDCGGCAGGPDGMYLANDILQAFNAGNVSEYNYWWGAANEANTLVEVYLSLSAPGYYKVTGRYHAMAAISRYVRPGAYRVATTNSNSDLNVAAFRNPDGSKVLEVLNKSYSPSTAEFTVDAATAGATPKTLLTDQNDALAETDTATLAGPLLSMVLPARSLSTVLLPPPSVAGNVQLVLTPTLTRLGDGTLEAALRLSNVGTGTAHNVVLTGATLGGAAGSPTPLSTLPAVAGTGDLAPGGYVIVPMNFAATAGAAGTTVLERYTGTYAGGSFGGSVRALLP